MTPRAVLATVLLAAFLLPPISSPAWAQQKPAAEAAGEKIETGTDAPLDDAIEKRIEGIFAEIDGLSEVIVSVKAGVVTLRGQVRDRPLALRALELAERIDGVVTVNDETADDVQVSKRLVPVFERLSGRLRQLVDYIPLFSIAMLAFVLVATAGWFIASLRWPWSRIAPNIFIAGLLRQLIRVLFIGLGLVLALDILSATALLGAIIGAAGIVGLAFGFAVRDTVENYISSILLSIRQPFRPNDHVLIDNQEGLVIRLTSRATILMSMEGNHIRIPNAAVYKGVITNFSLNPERRFDLELGVDADSNLSEAIEIGLATINKLDFILDDPKPDGWIRNVGDSNVVIWYSGWIDQRVTDFNRARSEATRLTKLALERSGFSLPEPIYRLRFDGNVEGLASPQSTGADPAARTGGEESEKPADTAADHAVTKKVDQERARSAEEDLLSDTAPREVG